MKRRHKREALQTIPRLLWIRGLAEEEKKKLAWNPNRTERGGSVQANTCAFSFHCNMQSRRRAKNSAEECRTVCPLSLFRSSAEGSGGTPAAKSGAEYPPRRVMKGGRSKQSLVVTESSLDSNDSQATRHVRYQQFCPFSLRLIKSPAQCNFFFST